MSRRLISSGSDMELKYGYSRAVVDGKWVFVSGTTGFDYAKGEISDDITEQTHQVFRNIEKALAQAGVGLADVVRARYIVSDSAYWEPAAAVIGDKFRDVRPAATAIIAALVDPRMKIEIEVTARQRGSNN
jgi:enamine deaminase RidA (YjgF/YER057c/UK114 family)